MNREEQKREQDKMLLPATIIIRVLMAISILMLLWKLVTE